MYPWNATVITPLHKKSEIYHPDNYRAIAVRSNLGKLFSSIMLERLIQFRKYTCPDIVCDHFSRPCILREKRARVGYNHISPDTENQFGFCQKARTADHLFSLRTCIEKYVKRDKRYLYSGFVDLKKHLTPSVGMHSYTNNGSTRKMFQLYQLYVQALKSKAKSNK